MSFAVWFGSSIFEGSLNVPTCIFNEVSHKIHFWEIAVAQNDVCFNNWKCPGTPRNTLGNQKWSIIKKWHSLLKRPKRCSFHPKLNLWNSCWKGGQILTSFFWNFLRLWPQVQAHCRSSEFQCFGLTQYCVATWWRCKVAFYVVCFQHLDKRRSLLLQLFSVFLLSWFRIAKPSNCACRVSGLLQATVNISTYLIY